MVKKCAMMAALALVLAPASARADWLFTPNIGAGFGGDASGREHLTYGAHPSAGWAPASSAGKPTSPIRLSSSRRMTTTSISFDSSNVTSFMVNVIIGVPVGGQTGGGFRPYFSGGVGLLQSERARATDDLFEVTNSEFGINLGGGAMGFMTDHVGFRGDVRYYRALTRSRRGQRVRHRLRRLRLLARDRRASRSAGKRSVCRPGYRTSETRPRSLPRKEPPQTLATPRTARPTLARVRYTFAFQGRGDFTDLTGPPC